MDRKVTHQEETPSSPALEAPAIRSLPVTTPLPAPAETHGGGVLLAPAAGGWRLIRRDASETARRLEAQVVYPTLLEAWEAAAIKPANKSKRPLSRFTALKAGLAQEEGQVDLEVAIPADLIVVEVIGLPSTEREELDGMVPLQLEKTLPYAIEEVLYGYRVVKANQPAMSDTPEAPDASRAADASPGVAGAGSTLSVVAVHQPAIEALLAPLLEKGALPTSLSLWADHLAAKANGLAYAIWSEGEEIVFALFEAGAIVFIETLESVEALFDSLPRLRIGAELAGASAPPAACYVDPAVIDLLKHRPLLSERLSVPGEAIATFTFTSTSKERSPLDFTPPAWRRQLAQRARKKSFLRRVLMGGMVYAGLLVLAFGGITVRKQQSRRLDAQLAAIRPQLDTLLAHQSRWKALGPAVDTRQFTLELMREIFESLPSPEVRVTLLEQGLGQFRVEVEAPTAAEAIDFGERLKAREALRDYQFEAGQPTLSGSDKAQYRLFGKL